MKKVSELPLILGSEVDLFADLFPLADMSGNSSKKITVAQLKAALGGAGTFNVDTYGASPAATGAANVTAIQAALTAANTAGGGTVAITKPGLYPVNATLRIFSNTTFVCGPGVILSKTGANFGEVIANDGAWTGNTDTNIRLIGVRIQTNGNQLIQAITSGLRGHISLYRIKDFSVIRCQMLDLPNSQFGLHICSWENMFCDDLRFEGTKDGLHLGTGKNGYVRNLRGNTTDDLLAINAHDWTVSNPTTGPITNLVIDGMVSNSTTRIMTGSWAAWANGFTYQAGDRVVSSGRVYTNNLAAGGSAAASVAPTHTSGIVTGADGIPWRFEYTGTNTETNVSNITFRDSQFLLAGLLRDSNNGSGGFYRAVTPGTEGNCKIEGLVFEGGFFNPSQAGQALLGGQGRFTDVSFRDFDFRGANIGAIVAHNAFVTPASYVTPASADLHFDRCDFDNTTWSAGLVSGTQGNFSLSVSGEGNRMGTLAFISGVIQRVNRFDLPYRVSHISAPFTGDQAYLRLDTGVILSGAQIRRRGRWVASDAGYLSPMNKRAMVSATAPTAVGTNTFATTYDGSATALSAGTTAAGYAMVRLERASTYQEGFGMTHNMPVVLSGTVMGQAINNGVIRILHGVALSLNTGFAANAAANAMAAKGWGLEIGQVGGTGNQQARIIAHNGTTYVTSAWVDLGLAPAVNNLFSYELVNLGNGTIQLYIGRPVSTLLGATILPDAPSTSIANGPTGTATDASTWAVATADGTTAPATANSIRAIIYSPELEYLAY